MSFLTNPRVASSNFSKSCPSIESSVNDLDDLVLQFDGSEAGKRFIEAWKRARIIVDSGGGHSNGGTPPAPPTPTPPA